MTHDSKPAYLAAWRSGRLAEKARIARQRLAECTMCPRRCKVDRTAGELGVCRTGARAVVCSFEPHFGEEAPLVGEHGSGTIFFSHCNLGCVFCQNYEISHEGLGRETDPTDLADMMLSLQAAGCGNINLVTPSHVVPQILTALETAAAGGLRIPLVYNSSGYDGVDTLQLLDGVVDIYMPDFKFWDPATAARLCRARDYPQRARAALLKMHGQVGDLVLNEAGEAERGMLIRHLVMPGGSGETEAILRFIATRLSRNSYVNIMSQYRPCGRAAEYPEINRSITDREFRDARRAARDLGLTRLDRPQRVFVWR